MLSLTRGRTFELVQTFLDTVDGPQSDMSHVLTIRCQIRTKGNNALVVTVTCVRVGAVVTLSLTRAQSLLIEVGDYLVDIVGTDVNGKDEVLMEPEPIRVVNGPTSPVVDANLSLMFSGGEPFLAKISKGSGWLPEPEDVRDYPLKMLVGNVAVPTYFELGDMSPVRDQSRLGACTGFAATAAVEHLRRAPDEDHWETIYSPLFTYYLARESIGYVQYDSGAYIRDAVKSLAKVGAARENDYLYYEVYQTFKNRPSERAFKSAASWKLGGYYLCNSLLDVKKAISSGFPVVGGFTCYSNIGQASGGAIPLPAGSVIGGHAVMFMGYDDTLRRVKFKNSWGPEWGDRGYGYLPYAFFERGLATDLWALEGESITPK